MGAVSKTLQRPPQVTSACLFIGLSCGLLLYTLIGLLTSWSSIDVQEGLADAFDASGVAMTDGRVESIRIGLQVVIVLLVAGLVCAIYALRRHAPSRIVLTVIAALTALVFLVIGFPIGLIPAAFAVYAVVQLWSPPARRWFAGEAEPAPAATPARPDPFAVRPAGGEPGPVASGPVGTGAPIAYAPVPQHHQPGPGRPRAVGTLTLVVTIASGLALVGSLVMVAAFTLARDELVAEYQTSSFTRSLDLTTEEWHALLRLLSVAFAVFAILSVAAIVAVLGLARRSRAAATTLLVLSILTVGVGVVTLPLGLIWSGLAVWAIILLRRPELQGWLADPTR